jgi:hypothetical protein
MKITEITKQSARAIKEMRSLYITYSSYGQIDIREQLRQLTEQNINSLDADVRKEASRYKDMLIADLIKTLSK